MLREGVRGSRIARTSGRALGQTRPIHVFRRGSFPSGRRCETPTRGGVSRKVRIRRPACWRGFPALHAGLCRKAGPYSSKGGGGDTGRSSKAAPGRDRRPDRVSRRGLRVQQRGADAVLFHQGIRNRHASIESALPPPSDFGISCSGREGIMDFAERASPWGSTISIPEPERAFASVKFV
jgi:hypothetical protein